MQASNPNSSTPTSPPEVVALYARWSGARSDTRTQVGHDFEPMYDGGDAHLGYVLAEEQPGTEPLYERWSSGRSDTRTQIGDDFEPG